MSKLSYIKNFSKDVSVAAIAPTSSYGVKRVRNKIAFNKTKCIVELGPGDGVITRDLIKWLPKDAQLLLIERNADFVRMLERDFPEERVNVLHRGAEELGQILDERGIGAVDYVISGIPFTLLKRKVRDRIISQAYSALRPGGKFIAYQTFWQPNEHLRDYLGKYFDQVETEFEVLNAPPLRIYEATKASGNGTNGRSGRKR